jgi:hypothetical protein
MEMGHLPLITGRENRTITFCPGCDWQTERRDWAAICCAPLLYVGYEMGVEDDAAIEHIKNERRAFQNKLRRGRQATAA